MSRRPIFDILPSRDLSPVECCFGSAGRNAIRPRDGPHAEPGGKVSSPPEGRQIRCECFDRKRGDRAHARYGLKPSRHISLFGRTSHLLVKLCNPGIRAINRADRKVVNGGITRAPRPGGIKSALPTNVKNGMY